jgi:hypothetical protein
MGPTIRNMEKYRTGVPEKSVYREVLQEPDKHALLDPIIEKRTRWPDLKKFTRICEGGPL